MPLIRALRVAQITDTHLFANADQQLLGLPTIESFQAVLRQVATLQPQPDLLLLTGDLSQDGKPESYESLQNLLTQVDIPAYWLPGNHDCLAAMQQTLTSPIMSPKKSFQVGGWQFVLLNSQVPGCVHGCLTAESLEWLSDQLKSNGSCPTVVGLHHPPFRVSSDWLDESTLQNSADLFAVLDRHPQVKLVLFGHIHQDYSYHRRGVQYLGTPSTCVQFEPHSSTFSLDQEQPGFRLLHLYPDGTWWTKVERSSFCCRTDVTAKGY